MRLQALLQGAKALMDEILSAFARLNSLEGRLQQLEATFKGVERVQASDGTEGLYLPLRVGIITKWFLTLPMGEGAALSVSTGTDNICAIVQHDGEEGSDGLGKHAVTERIALKVVNTEPNLTGTNTGLVVLATNAPHGNIGIDTRAQYSPARANPAATPLVEAEWKN